MNITRSLLAFLFVVPLLAAAQDWQMQPTSLATRWASSVHPENVWREYPRPQMVRSDWVNLNGLWDYAITKKDDLSPRSYSGKKILVPFPVESALSGVKRSLQPDELLWYRRTIHLGDEPLGERVLLHFGAVDFEATVFVNEKRQGTHSGGYQGFTFDITDALQPGNNELIVKVYDPSNAGPNPHGKQHLNAKWAFYSPSSGIWQTVWLERVPTTYIESLKLTPDVDRSSLRVEVQLGGPSEEYDIEATALSGDEVVGRREGPGLTSEIAVAHPRLWSPDDPHLYDLKVRLLKDGREVDSVTSYFGLRKIEVKKNAQGLARIYLNNRPTFNLTVVDQGFWPDGLYTAPSDAALKFDVQAAKALGFNAIRKHIKVEPQRWYYHCDQLGLMVWQDMPSGNNDTAEARSQFESELKNNLSLLHNHPSITMWVLFNEGWGAYDQERLARQIVKADPSRILNGHSGPWDQLRLSQGLKLTEPLSNLIALGRPPPADAVSEHARSIWMGVQALANGSLGNVIDLHAYPGPKMYPVSGDVASVVGEHGSFGVYVEGHAWDELGPLGLGVGATGLSPQEMLKRYADSIAELKKLEARGLSGSGYFETFDVETEQQGFITYDRAIAKVPVAKIERLNAKLVPRAKSYAKAVAGFSVENADWTPQSQRYAELLVDFDGGRRDLTFLRRLALMAIREKDQVRATEVSNAYVSNAPRPFGSDVWKAILTLTKTSKDAGFELLRAHADEVNSLLGTQQAEQKVLEVIVSERVVPYFKQQPRTLSWADFEESVAAEYGPLGREAVCGAWMIDAFAAMDWTTFGAQYVRYFETATARSPYPLHSLSYHVLQRVSDMKALEAAVRVMRWRIDAPRESPTLGRYDAAELDTYANLLYKVGRVSEAIDWEQRAATLSHGRDEEIAANLEKMKQQVSAAIESP